MAALTPSSLKCLEYLFHVVVDIGHFHLAYSALPTGDESLSGVESREEPYFAALKWPQFDFHIAN